MKKLQAKDSERGGSTGSATESIAGMPCPDAAHCQLWSASDGGAYCRLCWHDFTDPKPLQVTEGRA